MALDPLTSPIDGSYLLPNELMVPNNVSLFKAFNASLGDINTFMQTVQTAVYNYEKGFTKKVVINPADLQTYIGKIRTYLVNMGGGYDADGVTLLPAQATTILPDLLMTLRNNQLHLCRLYARYVDSQGSLVGPLDNVEIEQKNKGGSRAI